MSSERHRTRIVDGRFQISVGESWLDVGAMEDIYDLVGGETYTTEYSETEAAMPWLDVDENREYTFDIREVLEGMTFDTEFVEQIYAVPSDAGRAEIPTRIAVFADLYVDFDVAVSVVAEDQRAERLVEIGPNTTATTPSSSESRDRRPERRCSVTSHSTSFSTSTATSP